MCSRYTYTKNEAKLWLRDLILVFGAVPRANIRPTDLGPVIVPEHDGVACRELHWVWGVPRDKSPLINAKSKTLGTLAAFRPHLHQRCLLLADGSYEKGVLFRQPDGQAFCLAGLWREESGIKKYTMLTASPNESVSSYHHRMPFILKPEQYDGWFGDQWQDILNQPDHAPLEKIQKQPELF